MSIIKKFKSFFDDKNVNKYYWFNDEYQYLIDKGFIFLGDEDTKVGNFIKDDIKIEKNTYFQYFEYWWCKKRAESNSEKHYSKRK